MLHSNWLSPLGGASHYQVPLPPAFLQVDSALPHPDLLYQLLLVLTLKGFATLVWMACPQHRAEVHRLALTFVERCQLQPHMLAFNYDNTTVQVRVAVQEKIVDL